MPNSKVPSRRKSRIKRSSCRKSRIKHSKFNALYRGHPRMVKLLQLFPILLKLRTNNLLRIAQSIQALRLEGIYNPTYIQISTQSRMNKKTLVRNKEAIDIVKFVFAYKELSDMKCPLKLGTYSRGYMCPKEGDIYNWYAYDDPIWHYKGKHFLLQDGNLTYEDATIELPKRTLLAPIERVRLNLGITIDNSDDEVLLDAQSINFKHIMNTLFAMAIMDKKLITTNYSQYKRLTYGKHLFMLYINVITGSGRVHSKDKHLRWLNEKDTLSLKQKLFTTAELRSYKAGVFSMKYTPTTLMEDVVQKAIEYFLLLNFKENTNLALSSLDFVMKKSLLGKIKFRDAAILLNDCIGYQNGFIIQPEVLDNQYSRKYSCFTAISSTTRQTLGFINYDIGAALQTICLGLTKNPSQYLLHQELINDKLAFRQKVMQESSQPIEWVKQELSKLDNKETAPSYSFPTLQAYYKEAQQLRKDVIQHTQNTDTEIYNKAYLFSKLTYDKQWSQKTNKYIFIPSGRKESSLFFFIWTQYERKIREVMKQCFNNPSACQEVHDAVYSKEKVSLVIIEQAVKKDIGFQVKISH